MNTSSFTMRVPHQLKKAFVKKAEKYDKPSEVMRQLMSAFVDDRLIIQPPKDHPLMRKKSK